MSARIAAILVFASLAAACAPQRSLEDLYVPLGVGAGYGYTEEPVGERRFKIAYDTPVSTAFTYAGPAGKREANSELARAFDLALLRAAEIALANGAPAFRVADRLNDVDVRNYVAWRDPFYYPHWRRPWWGYPSPYHAYAEDYATLDARVTLTVDLLPTLESGAYDALRTQSEIRARYARPPT
jgi:hypothetical protein